MFNRRFDDKAIAPLKRNIPLTNADVLSLEELLFNAEAVESRERFEEVYGKNLSLKLFIRQLVGLDRNAAKQAFGKYLEGSPNCVKKSRNRKRLIK